MTYLDTAAKLLRHHEGVRHEPYDDATGQSYARRAHFLWSAADNAFGGHEAPLGNLSIGVGRNLEARPLSDAAVDFLLMEDLAENERQVRVWLGTVETDESTGVRAAIYYRRGSIISVGAFDLLSENRQAALLDLAHWGGIESGKNLREWILRAMTPGFNPPEVAWDNAGAEILWKDGTDESKGCSGWYDISPDRAEELAEIIETGDLPKWAKQEGESDES